MWSAAVDLNNLVPQPGYNSGNLGPFLWNRLKVVLDVFGTGLIPDDAVRHEGYVFVIPQAPFVEWASMICVPMDDGSFMLFGGPPNTVVTVLVWEPHTILGPGQI